MQNSPIGQKLQIHSDSAVGLMKMTAQCYQAIITTAAQFPVSSLSPEIKTDKPAYWRQFERHSSLVLFVTSCNV